MKIKTIMRKIQEADVVLTGIAPEESFNFAIDLNTAIEILGKFSTRYYDRMEVMGYTYKEAQDQLGEFLRSNLTILVEEEPLEE
jgi:hypothetical protein